MPATREAPVGAPVWFDLSTSDADKSAEFYRALFGWELSDPGPDYGGYKNFTSQGRRIAGMMSLQQGDQTPDGWMIYLKSNDAAATVDMVAAAGGTVMFDPMDVADLGKMAVIMDPAGATVGIWEPASMTGFEVENEPNAPVWWELHTVKYADEVAFYRAAFGWETEVMGDTDEFRYTQFRLDDAEYAGIMDATTYLPEDVTAVWEIYIGTSDVDTTIEKALALGGSVVEEPEDTPYGRLAKIKDPTGATIKLAGMPAE
jgi:predicted enzyme related to lactoylglutathione lyase